MQTGTLKELDVKPGDVVEWIKYEHVGLHTLDFVSGGDFVFDTRRGPFTHNVNDPDEFRIISRATPKTWAEMTPEEKGALLLAHHENPGSVEFLFNEEWTVLKGLGWLDDMRYRVRPEPVREVVTMAGYIDRGYFHVRSGVNDTHRITFDLIDGEPDCDSIKMERIT
jgi:hypothetical protein